MKRLTKEQMLQKRIRELMRAIRSEKNPITRNIYKEHLEYLYSTR